MMTKNRKIQLLVVILSLTTIFVGGTMAYFRAESQSETVINAKKLDIALMENTQRLTNNKQIVLQNLTPKSTIDKAMAVKNLEETGAYIKVTITKYWQNQEERKLPDKDASLIEIVPEVSEDWIIQEDEKNHEELYLYYKKPLQQNESTSHFMNQILIDKTGNKMTNAYTNLQINIDIEVEAIQQYGAKDAMISEWGLAVEIDQDGLLTMVEQ